MAILKLQICCNVCDPQIVTRARLSFIAFFSVSLLEILEIERTSGSQIKIQKTSLFLRLFILNAPILFKHMEYARLCLMHLLD